MLFNHYKNPTIGPHIKLSVTLWSFLLIILKIEVAHNLLFFRHKYIKTVYFYNQCKYSYQWDLNWTLNNWKLAIISRFLVKIYRNHAFIESLRRHLILDAKNNFKLTGSSFLSVTSKKWNEKNYEKNIFIYILQCGLCKSLKIAMSIPKSIENIIVTRNTSVLQF